MPQKRRRLEKPAQPAPAEQSSMRRTTRQTPVLPPLPPTSAAAAKVAHQAPPAVAGPTPAATATGAANGRPRLQPTASGPITITTTTTTTVSNSSATSQTPVPIPTPLGSGQQPNRGRQRPQSIVRPPPIPPASPPPVKTPVPVPIVTAVSPPSIAPSPLPSVKPNPPSGRSMSGVAIKDHVRPSSLVAPEITYHVPQPTLPGRVQSSLLRPHGPSALPPRLDRRPAPLVVTPVLPPKPPTLTVNDRGPPRADRNIDKVVLGDLCFRTWYPSYYGKEVLGDTSGNSRNGGGSKDGNNDAIGKASKRDKDNQAMLERLYVCPSCFKYAKELVAWRGHVRICERKAVVPGKKVYMHPRGRRKVLVAFDGRGPGPKRRRGDGGIRYTEEIVQDEGEWSIWEVDGEKHGLFCQNLSLFAKLFLDNKSVFFDVAGFNYFLLVYTPPASPVVSGTEPVHTRPPQVCGFFSKEKMSWDNNNLACILVFPPWQRKGLGALLMGASYEISRREGILGSPEKPISDLGKKGYKRFWSGEIARWLLGLEKTASSQPQPPQVAGAPVVMTPELIVDVNDCSRDTWIAVEDCLGVLRDMGVVEDAGMGYGKPEKRTEGAEDDESGEVSDGGDGGAQKQQDAVPRPAEEKRSVPPKIVPRVRVDKEAVRRYVATHRISLERTCDPDGFAQGYAVKVDGSGNDGERTGLEAA
ncbi:Acyl-CoA N-acyltransferase [Metarhizium album ARSEF 1941]|uniref:histone acetyltransferase n=1 Tax=Metarhizium album (strain ARSEF 1941) TaxID=1081103 RepID=A0A0B2WT23_METAS|nr:Acyl-CoA N-acyltransferase [Metarhizium album ARSEF 1941]KHN97188.1 Acyl-CoA N-acyltransferase [Metarhizium album ARSEF 1941]